MTSMGVLEYYANKSIFITGASGFIGKVLIEKLLRCCPGIKAIYLLMREKKGVSPQERLDQLTSSQVSGIHREWLFVIMWLMKKYGFRIYDISSF